MEIYYILLAVSIILSVCKSSIYNAYAKRSEPTALAIFGFNAAVYGVAALIGLVLFLVGDRMLSLSTVISAFFYAAVVFSLQSLSVAAMRVGSMSLTAICVMYGMIIPALAGPLFWQEPFGLLQAVGIGMMLLSLWLLNGRSGGDRKGFSKLWVILAVLCFVLSGMAGVMEKIHQSTDGRAEKAAFVLVACLFMFLFSLVLTAISRKKGGGVSRFRPIAVLGTLAGAVVGAYSIVNLTLAGGLDSIVYYPVANGGAMLLTVIVSALIFREKLDRLKFLGVLIGLCGIVFLSIPA